jgi:hypothetical protein
MILDTHTCISKITMIKNIIAKYNARSAHGFKSGNYKNTHTHTTATNISDERKHFRLSMLQYSWQQNASFYISEVAS